MKRKIFCNICLYLDKYKYKIQITVMAAASRSPESWKVVPWLWPRLLQPQHLNEILTGPPPYSLPFYILSEYPELWN